MKPEELILRYNFHDSLLEGIKYDEDLNALILEVDFCNWAQEDYTSDIPETMIIQLCFNGVIEISNHSVYVESSTISESRIVKSNKGVGIMFLVLRDYPSGDNGVDTIQIFAESVDIIENLP